MTDFLNAMNNEEQSIKLIKNTKGYNWEIKLYSIDIDKLEQLNNEMKKRFDDGDTKGSV